MSRSRLTTAVAAFGIAAITLTGCAPASSEAGESPAETADALEPTTITLYTSEPQEKADELVAAFNEVHPQITVEVFRAGTGDLTTRVATEQETGKIQADVFLAADAPPSRTTPQTTYCGSTRPRTSTPSTLPSSIPRASTSARASSRPSSRTTPTWSRRRPSRGPI